MEESPLEQLCSRINFYQRQLEQYRTTPNVRNLYLIQYHETLDVIVTISQAHANDFETWLENYKETVKQ